MFAEEGEKLSRSEGFGRGKQRSGFMCGVLGRGQ
jgi:hypothetical protein